MAGAGIGWGSIVFHSYGQNVHSCGQAVHSCGQDGYHGVERAFKVQVRGWSAGLSAIVVAFVLIGGAFAAAQEVPQLTVGRLADGQRPEIDGRVDETVWSLAEPFSAFIQQEPNEGEPATERTEIRFLIDRDTLYIGVVCFDATPDAIVVSQSRRDADLTETDSIQILLDTFNDGQNAFVFGTNPFGIEYDGQVMAEGQTAGNTFVPSGSAGSQRGQLRDSTRTGMPTGPCARTPPNAAGKPSSPSRSKPCGTARGRTARGASTSCATSGGRTSRSSFRRCRVAIPFSASRWPASSTA